MERLTRYETGPMLWRRFGVSLGRPEWRQGYSKAQRFGGLVTQWNLRIGPLLFYRIILWRGRG